MFNRLVIAFAKYLLIKRTAEFDAPVLRFNQRFEAREVNQMSARQFFQGFGFFFAKDTKFSKSS